MPLFDYEEKVASLSPSTSGFGRDVGQGTVPLIVFGDRFNVAIRDILGHVRRQGGGLLQRDLPARHPYHPWMVADRITNVQGVGKPTTRAAALGTDGVGLILDYANYPLYQFNVSFTHQPYACLDDSNIQLTRDTWFDEAGDPRPTAYSNEFQRFTSYETLPAVDVVTATHGFQKFRREDGDVPANFGYAGAPRIVTGRATLKVTWHFVPYSLIEDPKSPIVKYLGRINQKPWTLGNRTYQAGDLRYDAVGARRYLPPLPDSVSINGVLAFSNAYFCDLVFQFEVCQRSVVSPPFTRNQNWIAAGWNSRAWWNDGKFYYVTAQNADPTKQRPTYESFLVQHLFTDPVAI
jgi:hypothetical protein